jgi:hypothetical protein
MTDYNALSLTELLELEKKADSYMAKLRTECTVKSRQLIALAFQKHERLKQAIAVKQAIEDVSSGEGAYVQTK